MKSLVQSSKVVDYPLRTSESGCCEKDRLESIRPDTGEWGRRGRSGYFSDASGTITSKG